MTDNDGAAAGAALVPGSVPQAVAWALIASMAGIVVVSLLYILSPPALVAPLIPLHLDAARAGAVTAGRAVDWIAPLGMIADPLGAAALIAVGWYALREDRGIQAIGWLLLGLSSLLFVVIDTMAGAVLPALGRGATPDGFAAAKRLFDAVFVAGTLCLSIGALFLAARPVAVRAGSDWLAWAIASDGLLGLVSGLAVLDGHDLALPLGISVGVGAALIAVAGTRMLPMRHTSRRGSRFRRSAPPWPALGGRQS